ncbi:hypothetical protein BD311DRAFT_447627 [Dichomitus squalens]|uniref:Uncharacterized protein n=1 Tax=Dichomitus squalens TaxID=114155 RepID=A0A4Q9MJI7_9APHY|nr:hypothetical protein BD311DRAFT_447627 [Dichomitus squalens]
MRWPAELVRRRRNPSSVAVPVDHLNSNLGGLHSRKRRRCGATTTACRAGAGPVSSFLPSTSLSLLFSRRDAICTCGDSRYAFSSTPSQFPTRRYVARHTTQHRPRSQFAFFRGPSHHTPFFPVRSRAEGAYFLRSSPRSFIILMQRRFCMSQTSWPGSLRARLG